MVKLPVTEEHVLMVKQRLTSASAWRLPQKPGTLAPPGIASNRDQDPIPEHEQTWTTWDFSTYWMSDLINVTSWQIASSAMLVGLSTTDAIIITMLSGLLNAVPTVLNGDAGAKYHIPFPILVRSSYGYYFSYFAVVSRAILGVTWFGVNCWVGSTAVTETLSAVWPEYKNIENRLSPSSPVTTLQMVSYFLFFLIQLPFFMIPLRKLKTLFFWKAVLLLPVSVGMVIWICIKAGDVRGIFMQPAKVTGSTRAWLWLSTFSAITDSWVSSVVNMSDFSRFAKSRRAPYSQLPTIPVLKTLYAVLGIATVGAGRVLYDKDIWSPIELLPMWTGSGGRFLAFCCGCLWILAQISCNISANAVPFGHDVMNLAPAWIDVNRGSMICLFLGAWAVCPWYLVSSASQFLVFMNGYGCFICAMASIMMADYFLVQHKRLDVPSLYDPNGRYRFKGGVNWRVAVVQFGFMALFIPGIIHNINPSIHIGSALERIYNLNWVVNTFGPLMVYWLICTVFPDRTSRMSKGEAILASQGGSPRDEESSLGSEGGQSKRTDSEKRE